MSSNPAVLITDNLVELLKKEALYEIPFLDLTGTLHPWEVSFSTIKKIRTDITQAEGGLRQAYPDRDITCILAGDGAYWMSQGGLEQFLKELDIPLKQLKIQGPVPTWKMTSGEIFSSHVSNMRQLILAVSHDLVLLDQLKASLGNNHDFLHREFERCERSVRLLLEEIKNQGPNLVNAMSENTMLFERVRITQEMIERGDATEEALGYKLDDLKRAYAILDTRCKSELPAFHQKLQAIYGQLQHSLRDGESTQLSRSSRWEFAFSLIGEPPKGFRGQSFVAEKEREGMLSVVASREDELGSSELGRAALDDAQEILGRKNGKHQVEEPVAEPEPEPEPVPEKKSKRNVTRMAFSSRRR